MVRCCVFERMWYARSNEMFLIGQAGTIAGTIDSRIKTECIGCPPDKHPEEWFCAWRFSIPAEK